MSRYSIKALLPRGLYGRAALILLVPVVTLQLVVSVVFIQRYYESVTRQMTRSVVLELGRIVEVIGVAPGPAEADRAADVLAAPLDIAVSVPAPSPLTGRRLDFFDLSGRALIDELDDRLPALTGVDLGQDGRVHLTIESRHGPVAISFDRGRVTARNPHQLLVWMLFTGALMSLIAILFLRNQLRPITRLAKAAKAFGKGEVIDYHPSGALEVRAAGTAFLEMRARILRHIEQRTRMLSGVSHDLRSPLTRLRLALSMSEDSEETRAMARDLAEMEAMLDSFLDFARGEALDDPAEVAPAAPLAAAVERLRNQGDGRVTLDVPDTAPPARLRAGALERALLNLLQNALRHGGQVRAGLDIRARSLVYRIEDDGPGIPPERRDEALKAFVRLDPARNQDRGTGVGLGLAIAADIARQHGGVLRLGESAALGGLSAEIELPH